MKRSKSAEDLAREVVRYVQRVGLVGKRVRIRGSRPGTFGQIDRKWRHPMWSEPKYLVFHYPDPSNGIVKPDAWYFDYQLEIVE